MGGVSAERDVSLRSGRAVFNALKNLGYNAVAIEIVTGRRSQVTSKNSQSKIQNTKYKIVTCHSSKICEVLKKEKIEIVFLVLHGGYGENGAIQGLLEVMNIPYTGSGVLSSALAMDKEAAKKVFHYCKIPVPQFHIISQNSESIDYQLSTINFELPWVIKPATEGSSIGVNIVRDKSFLGSAMEEAFRFCERVIIEKYIEGKEIHVGILNNNVLGSVEVRPKLEFYNYEAKYTAGLTEYILPPEIQPETLRKAERVALAAHMALGCRGATRVDLIMNKHGEPYVLEVNTIPGMTETSLLPKIAGLSGLSFPSLIEGILISAIKKEDRA